MGSAHSNSAQATPVSAKQAASSAADERGAKQSFNKSNRDKPIKTLSLMTGKLAGKAKLGQKCATAGEGKQHKRGMMKAKDVGKSMAAIVLSKPISKLTSQPATNTVSNTDLTPELGMSSAKSNDSTIEKRRKSIQNGDVFIYPPIYKDLNECPNCARDNKICNCNDLDSCGTGQSSVCCSSSSTSLSSSSSSSPARTVATAAVSPLPAEPNNKFRSSERNSRAQLPASEPIKSMPCSDAKTKSGQMVAKAKHSDRAGCSREMSMMERGQQQLLRRSYKISIATASIDQRSNQLRLTTPKVLVPNKSGPIILAESTPLNPVHQHVRSNPHNRVGFQGSNSSPKSSQKVINICKNPMKKSSSYDRINALRLHDGGRISEEASNEGFERMAQSASALQTSKVGSSHQAPLQKPAALLRASQSASEIQANSIQRESLDSSNELGTIQGSNNGKLQPSKVANPSDHGNQEVRLTLLPSSNVSDDNNNTLYEQTCAIRLSSEQKPRVVEIGDQEEQLTCDLGIGEFIQITSTPISIGNSNRSPRDSAKPIMVRSQNDTSIVPIRTLSSRRRNLASKLSRQAINEDDDYSPAGSFDTQDFEQTPSRIMLPDQMSPDGVDAVSATKGGSDQRCNDVLEYSPILTSAREYIKNVNSELQVQASAASVQLIDESTPINGIQSSTEAALVVATPLKQTTIGVGETDGQVMVQTAFVAADLARDLESPKKSIFDGASKDEILEYLEDARERVPEILMAADDVMVIGQNELIVVNQLEPDSPATPISIVDTAKIIENDTPLAVASEEFTIQAHPGQLRQHLQQMYQTSQLAISQFASCNDTIDDDTGISSSCEQPSGLSYKLDSACNSLDVGVVSVSIGGCSSLDEHSSNAIANEDSLDDQIVNDENGMLSDRGIESQLTLNPDLALQVHPSNRLPSRRSVRLTTSSISNTSNTSVSEMSSFGLLSFAPSANYMRRRNSSSENSSQVDRNHDIRMMILQQSYSNRDSLSSTSSSSSSSTSASPSSSTSSQQTSGNCSVASTFYASSSLSSSSPLLALGAMQSNIGSNEMSTKPSPFKFDSDNLSPSSSYNVRLLESLIQGTKTDLMSDIGTDLNLNQVERDDSGLGSELLGHQSKAIVTSCTPTTAQAITLTATTATMTTTSLSDNLDSDLIHIDRKSSTCQTRGSQTTNHSNTKHDNDLIGKLSVIEEVGRTPVSDRLRPVAIKGVATPLLRLTPTTSTTPTFSSASNLMSRSLHSHYTTMSRLNNYFMNRHPVGSVSDEIVDFQCLDCDQFIDVDHATMLHKTNELRLLKGAETDSFDLQSKMKPMSPDQLDRAYIAAMNGLPLCNSCEKKRIERKEIISEFVETELKYGRDLKIIHDEFYRPMQIAGLLSKDQINGIFLNLEELIMAHCRFADRLEVAISEAHSMGDADYNTVNIGRLFVESAEMLHTFESYCIRQGPAACLLARLAKERELLRIFLRVSQMENTLLRRMNLAAFLMVPVQRVTKYPLLLNRLYKVTAYHHKDREALRDAQLKVELHLEHINQQTKGVGASNKIWRRISNLSAPISNRRGLINAEDIGYIKLRKTAMDMLKWDRDEIQFIHSGRINFAPLTEFLIKQKMKPLRYMAAHALLIVLGKPNYKYRPDLVKSTLDSKLMTPTPGGNGIKETALLLFREKNGRFVPCREPLYLSNCVLSNDCSQFNSECPLNQSTHHNPKACNTNTTSQQSANFAGNSVTSHGSAAINSARKPAQDSKEPLGASAANDSGAASSESYHKQSSLSNAGLNNSGTLIEKRVNLINGDTVSMSSMKSLPENHGSLLKSPPAHTSRSYSLASALPRTTITTCPTAASSSLNLAKPAAASTPATTTQNSTTILNQLMTKVNSYSFKQPTTALKVEQTKVLPINNNGNVDLTSNSTTTLRTTTASTDTTATSRPSALSSHGPQQCHGNSHTAPAGHNESHQHYNHHFYHNHNQFYGDYEESFEIHERLTKESMLLRADTPLKTRYWLQMLRYHAKDLGQWRSRRNGLANIMMMRQE